MAPAGQLVFDITPPPSFAAEDFVVGSCNAEARTLVETLAWPTPIGVVVGQAGSGKSHLAHLFAERFEGALWFEGEALQPDNAQPVIMDGLEHYVGGDEDAIFHMLEAARAAQGPVLVTSREAPENLVLERPDTISRLRAGARANLGTPDDALFLAIAVKLFADRQLLVDPAIADYLLQRMERSYANLSKLIALIDERSLAAGRSITKPLAREVLTAYELS